jgi:hypothetical protein
VHKNLKVGRVKIIGPVNLASTVAYDASQLYTRNIANFVLHIFGRRGTGPFGRDNPEIARQTLLAYRGGVVHPRVRELLGLPPAVPRGSAGPASQTMPSGSPAGPGARPDFYRTR